MSYITDLAEAIRREVDPSLLPEGDSAGLFRIYAVLTLAKGTAVSLEDVHNAWAAWMSEREPNHESIRQYAELSSELKREDQPFLKAIQSIAQLRRETDV